MTSESDGRPFWMAEKRGGYVIIRYYDQKRGETKAGKAKETG